MKDFIADLHIHSKYSRATSTEMDLENLSYWAKLKGITLLGTGDFTHPFWLEELEKKLEPLGNGIFQFKQCYFTITGEISCIYSKERKTRKIHLLLLVPGFEEAKELSKRFGRIGKIESNGRPILGTDAKYIARVAWEYGCIVIPAHIWTPHFSLFGAHSGFDTIEECFEDDSPRVKAIETGLSSDPAMNWRLSKLDSRAIVSFSDAHSPSRIGREACIMRTELSFEGMRATLTDRDKLLATIEFFPHEGKYHFSGHRNCGIVMSPEETQKSQLCPKCKREVTLGVTHRVEQLADRPSDFQPSNAPKFYSQIPLEEIVSEALNKQVATVSVRNEYLRLISTLGNEFNILLDRSIEEISGINAKIAEGIQRVREGRIKIEPGYDGVYGKISIFEEGKKSSQLDLFSI